MLIYYHVNFHYSRGHKGKVTQELQIRTHRCIHTHVSLSNSNVWGFGLAQQIVRRCHVSLKLCYFLLFLLFFFFLHSLTFQVDKLQREHILCILESRVGITKYIL